MSTIEVILVTIIACTIVVNLIPNKFKKSIIVMSTISLILDVLAFILIAF